MKHVLPRFPLLSAACALALAGGALAPANAQAPAGSSAPPKPEEILGSITVTPSATLVLPKVALVPSLSSDPSDVTLLNVLEKDLDLCGEVEVLPSSKAPEGQFSDASVDLDKWKPLGLAAVIRATGKKQPDGKVKLEAQLFLTRAADKTKPALEKSVTVEASAVRVSAHRLADALIGGLTGQNGGFASRLTFTLGTGKQRQAYVIDADGFDAHALSPANRVTVSTAFGPGGKVYYVGADDTGEYAVWADGAASAEKVSPKGSVYGLAWSRDRSKVVASIATGATIRVFSGPTLDALTQASPLDLAMSPTFTPSGKLAFVAAGKYGQRVYVADKPISPDGLSASAPTFCNHPDGVRAVFAVGVGKGTDLVSSGEQGGGLARLTQNQGQNGYPACSPDGRLVAFFSTRTSGQGPGLYLMRLDGTRPKRISPLVGDSLKWEALPASP